MALKCRDCGVVAHPECKLKCTEVCSPSTMLGRQAKGIYRVPGGERLVKDLREKYVAGKGTVALLQKVNQVHVVCGLLKDFLRKLKEPLVTHRLHPNFMQVAEIPDEDNATALLYQAIGELPKANRDTLAFLMLHFQRVMRSPQCQMDETNLARVFGPTIVGHGMAEPTPRTILMDTTVQPKVILCMLALPEDFWKHLLQKDQRGFSTPDNAINNNNNNNDGNPGSHELPRRMFMPLTSPEITLYNKPPSKASVHGRIRNFGHAFNK
ncbi:hypothetical protein CRUP_018439 [Coryphaenoides rupestris]|nr:hypothetical protein CRUP_018439 [Coryphaenoides rupestris]